MRTGGYAPSIKELLDHSGSDKGKWYGGLYEVLLQPARHSVRSLIEIGIGTLDPHAQSTMVGHVSADYRPGGSLRAWRDFLPNAEIHGVDVATDTQIAHEPRITTHICDSTSSQQTESLLKQMHTAPDVIIDDGNHSKEAQIATLRNFFPALRTGGLYIVEDVTPDTVPAILEHLARLHPSCPSFVDKSCGAQVAIVIRKLDTDTSRIIDYAVKRVRESRVEDYVLTYVAKPLRTLLRLLRGARKGRGVGSSTASTSPPHRRAS
jgi:hypothetical protein